MEIRCRFVFSGKNDELTPDFWPGFLAFQPDPQCLSFVPW